MPMVFSENFDTTLRIVELRNNFELQNQGQKLIIEHWITSSKYAVLGEILLKNSLIRFPIPTSIILGIIGFWTEVYSIY